MRSRLADPAALFLVAGLALAVGCAADQQNHQSCLKNDDCESRRCVQYLCVEPGASAGALPGVDASVAEVTSGEAGAETGDARPDSSPADTGEGGDADAAPPGNDGDSALDAADNK